MEEAMKRGGVEEVWSAAVEGSRSVREGVWRRQERIDEVDGKRDIRAAPHPRHPQPHPLRVAINSLLHRLCAAP